MNRIFRDVKLLFLVFYVSFYTGCYSLPLQELLTVGPTHSRQTRGLHSLHSRLCPSGVSRENCFYSQLSAFIRIQDSLVDPVNLRTIGKRNGQGGGINKPFSDDLQDTDFNLKYPDRNADNELNFKFRNFPYEFNDIGDSDTFTDQRIEAGNINGLSAKLDQDQFMQRISNMANNQEYLDNRNSYSEMHNLLKDSTQDDDYDELWNFDNSKRGFEDDFKMKREPTSPNLRQNVEFTSPSKRQIICPDGMARVKCYDNALAFYLRLLRSSDQ